jgi:hypothetical protein
MYNGDKYLGILLENRSISYPNETAKIMATGVLMLRTSKGCYHNKVSYWPYVNTN